MKKYLVFAILLLTMATSPADAKSHTSPAKGKTKPRKPASQEFLNENQKKIVIQTLDGYAMDVLEEGFCTVFFDDLKCSSASCVLKYHYNECGSNSNKTSDCLITGVSSFEQLNSRITDLFH